ncbi:MAG TPA: hypothetical protein VHP83_01595 [Aggregatilineaceae bacterium]|nr:hypothetical protein [Aggregatilineaceae bacterium]
MLRVKILITVALFISFILLSTTLSFAQSDINLEALAPITSENIDQLELITSFEINSEWVSFAISPDGEKIAVIDSAGLQMLDISTGERGEYLISESVSNPTFSADGGVLTANTTGLGGNKLFVINFDGGDTPEINSLEVAGIMGAGVALNTDGTRLAYSASSAESVSDGTWNGYHIGPSVIHLVELATMSDQDTFEVEDAIIGQMFFSPDGTQLSYSSAEWLGPMSPNASDAGLQVLDVETGETSAHSDISNILMGVSDDGRLAYFSSLNPLAGMVSCLSPVAVVNMESVTSQFTLPADDCASWEVGFSPDSTVVVAIQSAGSTVSIREAADGTEITTLDVDNAAAAYNPIFSRDGKLLLIASTVNGLANINVYGVPMP